MFGNPSCCVRKCYEDKCVMFPETEPRKTTESNLTSTNEQPHTTSTKGKRKNTALPSNYKQHAFILRKNCVHFPGEKEKYINASTPVEKSYITAFRQKHNRTVF
jgi:hypothetical protein